MSVVVLAPYVILALGFLMLGHAISSGSLGGFVLALLAHAAWLVPWGALAILATLVGLAGLGFHARLRWIAAAAVAAIAAGCLLVIAILPGARLGLGELTFLLPCLGAAAFGAWLAVAERPARAAPALGHDDRAEAL